ncbi:MAG: amidohydrolase family protein [Acidobacteria bacterium]|nr:amidohydrolase family protein [Acidobacteriota bacterium]
MKFFPLKSRALFWLAGGLLLLPAWLAAQAPDLILHNGKVITVDSNFSIAQAVAVTGNKISAVGTNDAVLALAGSGTQRIDLKGRTVTPGLIDTHRHMYGAAEGSYGGLLAYEDFHRFGVSWNGVKTVDDLLAQIKGVMEKYKFEPGRWVYITGAGNSPEQIKLHYDVLTQWDLDKVTPNNPILMSLGIPDFNGFMANKKAMDWLMTNHGDFVKKNGRIWLDAAGRPDGHLEPPASRLVLPFTYDRDPAKLAIVYERNMQEHIAMGMTAISSRMPKDSTAAYKLLEDQGKLTWRIGVGLIEPFGNITDLTSGAMKELAANIGKSPNGGESDRLWVTGAGPTAVDGVTSRACTDQKRTGTYTDRDSWFPVGQCHLDMEYRGSPKRSGPISDNYYRNWVMASAQQGVRFGNVHVAGDRGTGLMLNLIEQAQQQYGRDSTKNWGLDHRDMVNPKDFPRIGRTGVFMSCYIRRSVNSSADIARAYGPEVANTFPSPLNSMVKAGGRVVLESDSGNYIWDELQAAVTRMDNNGNVWAPQERVDRPTALKMLTSWAADYVLKGDKIGTIEKGKLADIVVLDRDYLTLPAADIGDLVPQLVLFDGKIANVSPAFSNEYNLRPAGAIIATYADLARARVPRQGVGGGGG